jgi:hypothetical protein
LRDEGRKSATLYTVSYDEKEHQTIFADLAHRGLLGWIRPAIAKKLRPIQENGEPLPEHVINEFNIAHQLPQRSLAPFLENTEGNVDYMIAHIDAPFISAEVAHVAEHVKSAHSIILQGDAAPSKLGQIEAILRHHRSIESMTVSGEFTVFRCSAIETPDRRPSDGRNVSTHESFLK